MSSKNLRDLLSNSIDYNVFVDSRGRLGVMDDKHTRFAIKRVFWISNVPANEKRGQHSHKDCKQVIVCLTGSFNLWLDGVPHHLNQNSTAKIIPQNTYIELTDFTPDAVCLVLCSEYYNEAEVCPTK